MDTPIDTKLLSELSFPELVIFEHTSLAEERFAKNGIQKNVHVVVKNTPFHITVGFKNNPNNSTLNFVNITAEVLLMYDCDGDRFVDFIKNKPIEYKGSMNEKGDKMIFEVRIKKLSSHLEDMFFKIRIKGIDNQTKEDIPYLYATSQPIKVVSKPEQVERIKQQQSGEKVTPKPRKKKRTMNEMMLESMKNIEKQQEEHKEMLKQILVQKELANSAKNIEKSSKKGASTDLEQAIQNLLSAYENTNATERPLKIRKVARNSSTSDVSSLINILTHLQSCMQRDQTELLFPCNSNDSTLSSNNILTDDFEQIDEFYRDLLLPSSF